jgi:hypothetical protein
VEEENKGQALARLDNAWLVPGPSHVQAIPWCKIHVLTRCGARIPEV